MVQLTVLPILLYSGSVENFPPSGIIFSIIKSIVFIIKFKNAEKNKEKKIKMIPYPINILLGPSFQIFSLCVYTHANQ